MTLEPKDMPLIITNRMDTVYLALGVFRWKTPSELGTEQDYAPPYIVAISKYKLDVLY